MADYSLWLKNSVTVLDPDNSSTTANSSKLYRFAFRVDDSNTGTFNYVSPKNYYYLKYDSSGRELIYNNYLQSRTPDLNLSNFVYIGTVAGSTNAIAIADYVRQNLKTEEEYNVLSAAEQGRYAQCVLVPVGNSTVITPAFPDVAWIDDEECANTGSGNIALNGSSYELSAYNNTITLDFTYYAPYPRLASKTSDTGVDVVGTASTSSGATYYYYRSGETNLATRLSYGSVAITKASNDSTASVTVSLNTDPRDSTNTTTQYPQFQCDPKIFQYVSSGSFKPYRTSSGETCEEYYEGTVVFSTKSNAGSSPLDETVIVTVDPTIQEFGIDDGGVYYSTYDGKVTENNIEKEQFTIRVYSTNQPYLFWDDQNTNNNGWTMDEIVGSVADPQTNAKYWEYTVRTNLGAVGSDYEKVHCCRVGTGASSTTSTDIFYIAPIVASGGAVYSGVYDGNAHYPVSSWPSYAFPVSGISVLVQYDTEVIDYDGNDGAVISVVDAGSYAKRIVRNGLVSSGSGYVGDRLGFYFDGSATINPRPITIHDITLS